MDEISADIVQQWLLKAESDLLNIRNNLASTKVPTDTVCFHAQQAIEKFLKCLLIAHGRNATRTHDLVKLLTDVSDILPELLVYEEQLEVISEYGVAVRYPDNYWEPEIESAQNAFSLALKIEKIVKNALAVN